MAYRRTFAWHEQRAYYEIADYLGNLPDYLKADERRSLKKLRENNEHSYQDILKALLEVQDYGTLTLDPKCTCPLGYLTGVEVIMRLLDRAARREFRERKIDLARELSTIRAMEQELADFETERMLDLFICEYPDSISQHAAIASIKSLKPHYFQDVQSEQVASQIAIALICEGIIAAKKMEPPKKEREFINNSCIDSPELAESEFRRAVSS